MEIYIHYVYGKENDEMFKLVTLLAENGYEPYVVDILDALEEKLNKIKKEKQLQHETEEEE